MIRFKLPVKEVRKHLAHPFLDRVGSLLPDWIGQPGNSHWEPGAGMLMKGIPGDLWSLTMSFCLYLPSC